MNKPATSILEDVLYMRDKALEIEEIDQLDVIDYDTPAIDEQRPTTDGKVKNTLTGEVHWPTWEHISEIEPDVGRNKAW